MEIIKTKKDFDAEALYLLDKIKDHFYDLVEISESYSFMTDDPENKKLRRTFYKLSNELHSRCTKFHSNLKPFLDSLSTGCFKKVGPLGGLSINKFVAADFEFEELDEENDFSYDIDFSSEIYTPSSKIRRKIFKEFQEMSEEWQEITAMSYYISKQKSEKEKKDLKKQIREYIKIVVELVALIRRAEVQFLKCKEYLYATYTSTEVLMRALQDRGYKVSN